jgi:acyl-CoA synthetase (AMP-forming)/AMP-acid ligase II
MARQRVQNYSELLATCAYALPEHVAFTYVDDDDAENSVDFGDLHHQALGVAHELLSHSRPGDRALLLLPPGLEYVAAIFGCFYSGVIGVSAPPPQPRRLQRTLGRLLRIAESSGATTVITTSPFADAAKAVIPPEHPLSAAKWIAADITPSSTDGSALVGRRASDVAFLQYTSGSTSDPRGVRLTHGNLLDNSRFIAEAFGHDPVTSLGFNWIPPFHDMGLIGAILQPVYLGGMHPEEVARSRNPLRPASVLASPLAVVKRPIRWLEGVSRFAATTSGGPNFAYDMCVERIAERDCEGLDLSSWKVAFNGSEPIRGSTMQAFSERFGAHGFRTSAFFPVYGLAEATLMATAPSRLEPPTIRHFDANALLDNRAVATAEEDGQSLVGCGTPDSKHRLEIVDPASLEVVAPGAIGEIWLRGPSVADGYWTVGDESDRTFDGVLASDQQGDQFLRTGDLGTICDGELFVTGRQSDLIILNGRNHHPHDIESLAESIDLIFIPHSTAAFELRSRSGEPRVGLVMESTSADTGALEQAIDAVRARVAADLDLPLSLVAVCTRGAIPKTTSGKIQRSLCRTLLVDGELEIIAEWRSPDLSPSLEPA